MRLIRNLLMAGAGIAAAVAAYKLMKNSQTQEEPECILDQAEEAEEAEETEQAEEPEEPEQTEEPTAQAEAPAQPEQEAQEEPQAPQAADAPNVNPVTLGAATAPKDEAGKFDATKIASPEDFGDWDSLGCGG